MNLEFDARYDAFRAQVSDFLADHRPAGPIGLGGGRAEDRVAWLSLLIEHKRMLQGDSEVSRRGVLVFPSSRARMRREQHFGVPKSSRPVLFGALCEIV